MRKRIALTEPSMSGTRRRFSEPAEGNSMAMNELRNLILSADPKEKADGAWEAKCRAERGDDITALMPAMGATLRAELKAETLRNVKVYLAQALAYCARTARPTEDLLRTASSLLSDTDMHVRYFGGCILHDSAKSGADIGIYADLLVSKMEDMAPLVQEICLSALKAQASRGKMEAHHVFLSLGETGERLNELVREKREDLKQHCMSVLSQ